LLTASPEEPSKFVPGSEWPEWRDKKSRTVVTLQELVPTKGVGMAYLMSDGKTTTSLDLMLKFEAV